MIKKTIIKIIAGFTVIFSVYSASAAGGAMMMGISGTLKNIEKAMRAAVLRTEELYEQNGGAALGAPINLVDPADSANPFLQTLQIETDYSIRFTFAGTTDVSSRTSFVDTQSFDSSVTIPVAKALEGRNIHLIPIVTTGDTAITTWECITNMDDGVNLIMGGLSAATSGNISFIARPDINQGNVYLSNCIFVTGYNFSY